MRIKAFSLLSLTAFTLLAFAPSEAQSVEQPQVLNRPFSQEGRVEMQLQHGDYQIRRSKEDKIHVEWRAKSSKLDQVKVELSTNGGKGKLSVQTPDSGDVHMIIEVPATTNLYVRLSAGDLNIEGISGDKDIESHAGDVTVDVGDPDSYGLVDASVNIGDLTAGAFNVAKSGFHNNLRLNGTGRYTLHAHVDVGDLVLYGKKKEPA
jgi:hypothetical protein